MDWPILITNRTAADVTETRRVATKIHNTGWASLTAAEQAAWTAGMKGGYWATDLNRVGAATQHIKDLLTGYGYPTAVAPKTDWTVDDAPTPEQAAAYLADIETLIAVFHVYSTTPALPGTIDALTWDKANDIEANLTDLKAAIEALAQSFKRVGTFHAGEEIIL